MDAKRRHGEETCEVLGNLDDVGHLAFHPLCSFLNAGGDRSLQL